MLRSTLTDLRCPKPKCSGSELKLEVQEQTKLKNGQEDVLTGSITCAKCRMEYPILAGVAVVVEDPGGYLIEHVKGVAREVPEKAFPKKYRREMVEAFRELVSEHIEEDLESERVASLYVMTHYLRAQGEWWKPKTGEFSRELEELVTRHWDHGPFEKIHEGIRARFKDQGASMVELGCGVGGLFAALSDSLDRYLGVDSSFASIALARRILLGAGTSRQKLHVPGDLLEGSVSQDVTSRVKAPTTKARCDFIVGDATAPALKTSNWEICASLNMIDMLESPEKLPQIQKSLVRPKGLAIQSSPYIWHPRIAAKLKKSLPQCRSSAEAVTKLYERAGFRIDGSLENVPWLFFKNYRQIELYSVHVLFRASMSVAHLDGRARALYYAESGRAQPSLV